MPKIDPRSSGKKYSSTSPCSPAQAKFLRALGHSGNATFAEATELITRLKAEREAAQIDLLERAPAPRTGKHSVTGRIVSIKKRPDAKHYGILIEDEWTRRYWCPIRSDEVPALLDAEMATVTTNWQVSRNDPDFLTSVPPLGSAVPHEDDEEQ